MVITIENTSSPGASFTENTNNVLLKTYEWITEHSGTTLSFLDFRMKLQQDKMVNDNNNRNIYPLLKNGGLVCYEKGGYVRVEDFFTKTGLAYVKALQAKELLPNQNYTNEQVIKASNKFDTILSEIVCKALQKLVSQPDVNYVEPFQDLIKYILVYNRISKVEYAYLLYVKTQTKEIGRAIEDISKDIDSHRKGDLSFKVKVKVRNDIRIRERTNSEYRLEGISYLTSFGYFVGLLQQAGLLHEQKYKKEKYYEINSGKRDFLVSLGGI